MYFKPEPTTWSTRRLKSYHTQTGSEGAAIEYAIDLVNILGIQGFTILLLFLFLIKEVSLTKIYSFK